MANHDVVVVGAGVVGCAVALHLAESGHFRSILVIEAASAVAPGASGKAGGFLARAMCDGEAMESLSRTSFALHEAYAAKVGPSTIGYRKLEAVGVRVEGDPIAARGGQDPRRLSARKEKRIADLPAWLNRDGSVVPQDEYLVASESDAAQVDPLLLCQSLARDAVALGVRFLFGKTVVGVARDHAVGDDANRSVAPPSAPIVVSFADSLAAVAAKSETTSVDAPGDVLRCKHLVVCTGAWTHVAATWFPAAWLKDIRLSYIAHSIVFRGGNVNRDGEWNKAIFASHEAGGHPEIYPRSNGDVYCCGFGESVPVSQVPALAEAVVPLSGDRIDALQRFAYHAAPALETDAGVKVVARQACYLPLPPDGRTPLIGKLDPDSDHERGGVWIAAGHSCWGVLNCLGTGLAMRELLTGDGICRSIGGLDKFAPPRRAAVASLSAADRRVTKRGDETW